MRKAIVHQEFVPDQGVLSFYTYEALTKLLHDLVAAYPALAAAAAPGSVSAQWWNAAVIL